MRKDVKFGLTIGGILAATVIVYVLAVSRSSTKKVDNDVTVVTGGSDKPLADTPQDSTPTPLSPAMDHHADQSSPHDSSSTPSDSSHDTGPSHDVASNTPADVDTTHTPTDSSTNKTGSDPLATGSHDWTQLMAHGVLEARSPGNVTPNDAHPTIDTHAPTHSDSAQSPAPGDAHASSDAHSPIDPSAMRHPSIDHPGGIGDLTGPERTVTPVVGQDQPMAPRVIGVEDHPSIDSPTQTITADSHSSQLDPQAVTSAPVDVGSTTRPAAAGQRTHRVASHETLATISQAVYGSSKYWLLIAKANPSIKPSQMRIGTILIIPQLDTADHSNRAGGSAQPVGSDHGADVPRAVARRETIDSATAYRVESGDTLEKIATKLWGDPEMKSDLFAANKTLMKDGPNRLKIGWVLKLPKAPTQTATASR